MKNKVLWFVFSALIFSACNQKEMKVSRSDFSVVTEMNDFSPGYIDKDKNGEIELNRSNFIGNTHWVLSVNRDLTLNEIGPFLKQLTDKKHAKGGMHDDLKDIYFVYSDTVHKQNAYVKLPFRKIYIDIPQELGQVNEILSLHGITSIKDFKEKISQALSIKKENEKISLGFNYMSVEEFVNILIEIEKLKITDKLSKDVSFYK